MTGSHTALEALREAPLFADLPEDMRAEVAARGTPVHLAAGEWLFRQGDPGDRLFVVLSGSVEAVLEAPEPAIIRVMRRGAIVGELALLTGSPRSASIRARRDSELLEVTQDDFGTLLVGEPRFILALTRVLGAQVQASRSLGAEGQPRPSTITLVGLEPGLALTELAAQLVAELGRHGPVTCLGAEHAQLADDGDGEEDRRFARLLDRAEREHDQVVLIAGALPAQDPWSAFCLRQADRVVAVAGGERPRPAGPSGSRLAGCELCFWGRSAGPLPTSAWHDTLAPRATTFVARGGAGRPAIAALARRLAGRSVGVVFSGGGARGMAHIGVIEGLLARGVTIDRVGGASMGAYVGAQLAMGLSAEAIRVRCQAEFVDRNPLNDYTLPLVSLVRGGKAAQMMLRVFGEQRLVEELPHDFFSVSCDIVRSELVIHRRGLLAVAVGASAALPGICPPVPRDERILVDGGVLNNLPVDVMAARGEGPVIAVDVTAPAAEPRRPGHVGVGRRGQLAAALRRLVVAEAVGDASQLPSFPEILMRTVVLGSIDTSVAAQRFADATIRPAVANVGLTDFHHLDHLCQAGREAVAVAFAQSPQLAALAS